MSSLADIRARLAALRGAAPTKRPPVVAAVQARVRLEKPPDATAPVPPPATVARSTPPGQARAERTAGASAEATGATSIAPEGALLQLPPLTGNSVTLSRKQMEKDARLERKKLGPKEPPVSAVRPRTRGDCFGGERPCPFVSCRYHTYLEVTEAGSLVVNHPDVDPSELKESCSLDLADRGPLNQEQIGQVFNVTRGRVQQLEVQAMQNLAVAIDPAAAAAAGVPGARFKGSCKARCALTGKYCALPSHGKERKHRCGHWEFHLVALDGQTLFPRANAIDGYATRREAADGY